MLVPPEPDHLKTGRATVSRMMDARHYSVKETLRNGAEVRIRSLHPDDGERMEDAFKKLEVDSIRSRFFGIRTGLTEEDHRLIRELDFDMRVVLVVTLMEAGREIIIGSGSYSRVGKAAAEIAFLVEEDYHGQGVARRILWHLGLIARECGIARFKAEVLPQNLAMRRVFAASGWAMTSRKVDDVVQITLDLTQQPD